MRRRKHNSQAARLYPHNPDVVGYDFGDTNAYMLCEDIALGVMPIIARSAKNSEFIADLRGPEEEVAKGISILNSIRTFDRHDFRECICDLVEQLARELAWHGGAAFEILREKDEPVGLENIPRRSLYRLPFFVIQLVRRNQEGWSTMKLKSCQSKYVWFIDMPSEFGGYWGHRRMLDRLSAFPSSAPKFFQDALMIGRQPAHLDLQVYYSEVNKYCRRAVQKWGWNFREIGGDKLTEFYAIHQTLSFRIAQAKLREHIISELNELLKLLGISCILVVQGLPTSLDMIAIRKEMSEGDRSFSNAIEATSL